MSLQRFSYLRHTLLDKAFNIWVKCYNGVLNLLFYLPCGGENSFRRRCAKFAFLKSGDWILDVCCGTGELMAVIAGQGFTGQLVGVDIAESALKEARARTQHVPITFLRANADDLPLGSSRFDKCFISFGLHHMPKQDRQKTLREIRRSLISGGTLIIIDYNLPERGLRRLVATAFAKLDKSEEAYKIIKNGSLLKEIKQAGLEIQRQDLTCQGIVQLLEAVRK